MVHMADRADVAVRLGARKFRLGHGVISVNPSFLGNRSHRVLATSPAVMTEGLVGLSHTVRIFAFLYRRTTIIDGVHQFVGQPILHRMLAPLAGRIDDPTDRERLTPLRSDF